MSSGVMERLFEGIHWHHWYTTKMAAWFLRCREVDVLILIERGRLRWQEDDGKMFVYGMSILDEIERLASGEDF